MDNELIILITIIKSSFHGEWALHEIKIKILKLLLWPTQKTLYLSRKGRKSEINSFTTAAGRRFTLIVGLLSFVFKRGICKHLRITSSFACPTVYEISIVLHGKCVVLNKCEAAYFKLQTVIFSIDHCFLEEALATVKILQNSHFKNNLWRCSQEFT